MYRLREPNEFHDYPGEDLHQSIVVQDARGDYYYYYEDAVAGDINVARFRSTRGTMPEDFVKNHFRGAVMGVDMDRVCRPLKAYNAAYLMKEQADLVELRKDAESQFGCACAKLKAIEPYKSKFRK